MPATRINNMSPTRGALAFKLHTGWAAFVVVTGEPGSINVLVRRRLELLPSDGSIPRFIYHSAAELPLSRVSLLVKSAGKAARETAQLALTQTLRSLKPVDIVIRAAAVLTGSTSVPDDLSAVLASHALIHAAEGYLFQQAVVAACESCRIDAITIRERDLWGKVASAYGQGESSLRDHVDALRRSVGPPWGADQSQRLPLGSSFCVLVTKRNRRRDGERQTGPQVDLHHGDVYSHSVRAARREAAPRWEELQRRKQPENAAARSMKESAPE